MSGASIDITIDDTRVHRMLRGIQDNLMDLRPGYAAIGEYMLRRTDERFRAQKDPEGRPWAPLSPATLAVKKNRKILTERGRLRNIAYRESKDHVRIGTNMVYGAVHQFGIDETVRVGAHRRKVKSRNIGRGKKRSASGVAFVGAHTRRMRIPARPYLGVNAEDRNEAAEILLAHILATRERSA